MNAQSNTTSSAAPSWSGWQGTLINGTYPLQRLLTGSERSAIFLSECQELGVSRVAVKIIPIERVTLAQLSHWKLSARLSHPHLVRLFDAGLCHLGGQPFLFVVMEYAEQTLSEVLGQRPLTIAEVRDMLPPTLEALAYLHGQGLVQCRLKPSNILVVDDQLKLATDTIRSAGAPRVGFAEPSLYDPPESTAAGYSSADDVWGLGMTVTEALTQRVAIPAEPSDGSDQLTLPPEFAALVGRCLRPDPAERPSVTTLQEELGCAPDTPPALPVPAQLEAREQPREVAEELPEPRAEPQAVAPMRNAADGSRPLPVLVAIGLAVSVLAVWGASHLLRPQAVPAGFLAKTVPAVEAPPVVPAKAAVPTPPAHPPPSDIVHEQMPHAPRPALATIHGRIKVSVLVVVDRGGAVRAAQFRSAGPSAYFAAMARSAARNWTFVPANDPASRKWLLHFEFTRGGVSATATPAS
ncbi:MAG TPA: protein kinase [Steroidobacteraceae bacterium]|nr:protein kinase [Steroidobacteraceae bacterium]